MNMLHIFPYSVFLTNYVKGFNKRIKGENNYFWVYGSHIGQENRQIKVDSLDNIYYAEEIDKDILIELYMRSDILVIQCIPDDIYICEILYNCYKQRKIPLVIVPWGRELFEMSDCYRNETDTLEKVKFYKDFFVKNCSYLICSKYAYDYVQNVLHINCANSYFNPLNTFSVEDCKFSLCEKKSNLLRIMVGHRGTYTSQQIQVFKKLSQFDKNEISIFCPLVYGNQNYIKEIEKEGNTLFGENIFFLKDWMQKQNYYKYLSENIDVGIFNNESLEGANTIFFLIYAGKKVFVNRKNEIYWILKDLGIVFYEWSDDTDLIEIEKTLEDTDIYHNRAIMNKFGLTDEFRKNWSNVFKICMDLNV